LKRQGINLPQNWTAKSLKPESVSAIATHVPESLEQSIGHFLIKKVFTSAGLRDSRYSLALSSFTAGYNFSIFL